MASASDSTPVPSRRAFLAHAALSGVAATRPPIFTVPEPPDADLITLGADLTAAWTRFSELESADGEAPAVDAAYADASAAAKAIAALRATTLAGLLIKARAIAWYHLGETLGEGSLGDETSDVRLARTIVGDLLAMA
ncbi:hypothetical protein ACQKQD_06420 [Methylobacterium sp. NPDC080182]|uniref:hypothetical protein n=1 Tax=Methylobacterium sp. NPDC080182 TaxID=3390590 RepID=UPI003D0739A4